MIQPGRLIHDFPSCARTYATLCIYHDSADPQQITDSLQILPDRTQKVNDLIRRGKTATVSGWFLGTKDIVKSKDMRAHVKWILNKLKMKKKELRKLSRSGYTMWISVFWESSSGNGGPELDHEFIKLLSEFPLELHFDIWFDIDNILSPTEKRNKGTPIKRRPVKRKRKGDL